MICRCATGLFVELENKKLEFFFRKKSYSLVVMTSRNEHNGICDWFCFFFGNDLMVTVFSAFNRQCFQFQRNASSDNSKACASIWIVCVAMKSNHSLWSVRCSIVRLECNNHRVARGFGLEGSNYMCKKICACMFSVNDDAFKIHAKQMVLMNGLAILIYLCFLSMLST